MAAGSMVSDGAVRKGTGTNAGSNGIGAAGTGSAALKGGGSTNGASAGVATKTAIDSRDGANWPTQTLWSEVV